MAINLLKPNFIHWNNNLIIAICWKKQKKKKINKSWGLSKIFREIYRHETQQISVKHLYNSIAKYCCSSGLSTHAHFGCKNLGQRPHVPFHFFSCGNRHIRLSWKTICDNRSKQQVLCNWVVYLSRYNCVVVSGTSYDQRIYVYYTPSSYCATVSVWCFKMKFRGTFLKEWIGQNGNV